MEIPLAAIGADTTDPVVNANILSHFITSTLAITFAHHPVHPRANTDAPATRDITEAQGQDVKVFAPTALFASSATDFNQRSMIYAHPTADSPSRLDTIQIYVKTLSGKTTICHILPVATVHELMLIIQASDGTPADSQRLIFGGKQLGYRRDLAGVSDR